MSARARITIAELNREALAASRCVYRGWSRISAYVAERASRRGVGPVLLERLIASNEAAGIWTIQTGIFPEKRGQRGLPERAGFEIRRPAKAGLGTPNGHWGDVLLLEPRSDAIE